MKSIILLILSIVLLIGLVLSRRTYHHKDDDAFSSGTTQKWRQQRMLKQRALCEDRCVARYHDPSQCNNICEELLSGKRREYKRHREGKKSINNRRGKRDNSLSDLNTYEEQQMEATRQLWELYDKNLRSVLNNGLYEPGFQVLHSPIFLTDIQSQIPGWESMPIGAIVKANADDYDNPVVLGQELIQVSKVGPFRETISTSIHKEYMDFLAGVKGVSEIGIPNLEDTPVGKSALKYEQALNNCSYNYESSSTAIKVQFSFERYKLTMCSEVRIALRELNVEKGKDFANSQNKVFDAAVALGLAKSKYTASTAFKKNQSFRAIEYECLMAQSQNRPMQGQSKTISFLYDYHHWRNTADTIKYTKTKGWWIFKKTIKYEKTTHTTMDLTGIGGVSIKFTDMRYIPILPGEWYSTTAYANFRYLPREASASPISRFFSPSDGTLKLFPKGLYVVTNPHVTFVVDSKKKDEFKQQSETLVTGGFSIFGIGFNSLSHRMSKIDEGKTSGGKTEITFISNDCKPQLLAVANYFNY